MCAYGRVYVIVAVLSFPPIEIASQHWTRHGWVGKYEERARARAYSMHVYREIVESKDGSSTGRDFFRSPFYVCSIVAS